MAEKTFLSPAVSTREIDLSQPTSIEPSGVPAGVIGTARRGPAFVPVTVATFQDFVAKFGNTDGEAFGPLAMNEWMRNASAGTYVRLLGVGDAKARNTEGRVNRAGFIVGDAAVQDNGRIGVNPYAYADSNQLGRGYILGCFMSESAGSTVFSEAGIQDNVTKETTISATVTGGSPANKSGVNSRTFIISDGIQAFTGTFDSTVTLENTTTSKLGTSDMTETAAGMITVIKAYVDLLITKGLKFKTSVNGSGEVLTVTRTDHSGKASLGQPGVGAPRLVDPADDSAHFVVVSNLTQTASGQGSVPIARGILMVPSGVVPTLSSVQTRGNQEAMSSAVPGDTNNPQAATGLKGSPYGDVTTANGAQEFVLMLNGHKQSDAYVNVITASFDPAAPNNFRNILNTDPTKIEDAGHYLYADWQIGKSYATVTGSNRTPFADPANVKVATAFIVPSSGSRNTLAESTSTKIGHPNLEGFDDRFRTAFSPFVISQKFGGKNENLFRFHALDDGQAGSDTFKVTIQNIIASTNENRKYGSFDVLIRRFDDTDADPQVLEKFSRVDLDPSSDRYIGRVIGDTHIFYDFDKKAGGQKLVVDGLYPNASQYVRVETAQKLDEDSIDETALPVGFRGLHHLVTSGSATAGSSLYGAAPGILSGSGGSYSGRVVPEIDPFFTGTLGDLNQLPVPFRTSISRGTGKKKRADANLTWGIQFEEKHASLNTPNKLAKLNESLRSFVRYFPRHLTGDQNVLVGANEGTPDVGGSILDADRYNNNLFTLERVQVIEASNGLPDVQQWGVSKYRRKGNVESSVTDIFGDTNTSVRLIQPSKDFAHLPSRKYLKFTFPLQGGFDGVNIFDKDKSKFTDNAVRREIDDASNQGGTAGPTVAAYRKAIDVMEQKSDVDIQILTTPGIRHTSVTDFAIDSVERRFDALYIMDIEERDTVNTFVTASDDQIINVSNTARSFTGRNLDSSFAAAYFPDVIITDPATKTNVQCPPTVAVIGALSLNDALKHPWFAPAGFSRGALDSVVESKVKLNQSNLDELYSADINPLAKFAHDPRVAVFGQKTLLANASALDRVNVRRLLIEVRRQVRAVANTLLFEPNRADTLNKFSAAVTPILTRIQSQQGLDRFKVQIDTTTTTQADVENNTIRGKIFLQPTKAVEFISLDFVVTNAGAEI